MFSDYKQLRLFKEDRHANLKNCKTIVLGAIIEMHNKV